MKFSQNPILASLIASTALLASPDLSAQGSDGVFQIMPLGDSITAGVNWHDDIGEGAYRTHLEDLLQNAGINFDFVGSRASVHGAASGQLNDNDHQGYGGYSINGAVGEFEMSLLDAIRNESALSRTIDVVLLLVGANDVVWFPGNQPTDAQVRQRYNLLLDEIRRQQPFIPIIISTLTPTDDSVPAATASLGQVQAFNNTLRSLIANRGDTSLTLVDGYSALNQADILKLSTGINPATGIRVPDGIHPTPQGYQKLAEVWYNALQPIYWDVDGLYTDSVTLGSGWRFSAAYGSFYDGDDKTQGWKYHESMGWIYTAAFWGDNLYFWEPAIGWGYSSRGNFPNIYLFDRAAWFYYDGSVGRQIYNYVTERYEAF